MILLPSESPSGKCANLHTVAANNNRDHTPRSLYYYLFFRCVYRVFFFAHIPFMVNRAFQHSASRVVATTSPPLFQRTAPIAHSFSEGFTQNDLNILVTAPFCCDRKTRAASAQSFTLLQQATMEDMRHDHSIIFVSATTVTCAPWYILSACLWKHTC